MTIRKLVATTALILSASPAFAKTETVDFDIVATVPATDFIVVKDLTWSDKPAEMLYNVGTKSLQPNTSHGLNVQSTIGDITAYLVTAPTLGQVGGAANIPLRIEVGGVALPVGAASPATILEKEDAATLKPLSVGIFQADTTKTLVAGEYRGNVVIMFETSA